MSNTKTFNEIFKEVESKSSRKEKIEVLHANSSAHLKNILSYTFNPNIKWIIPEGTPPFDPPKEDLNHLRSRLLQEMKNMVHFLNIGPYPNLPERKRQSMFIDILQTIHPDDAALICYIKDNRSLPYKGVTKKLIETAFPLLAEKWNPTQK